MTRNSESGHPRRGAKPCDEITRRSFLDCDREGGSRRFRWRRAVRSVHREIPPWLNQLQAPAGWCWHPIDGTTHRSSTGR